MGQRYEHFTYENTLVTNTQKKIHSTFVTSRDIQIKITISKQYISIKVGVYTGPPWWLGDKEPACPCRRHKRHAFDPWVGKIPWRRAWQPIPVFLPGASHQQRSLACYSP